MKLNSVFSLLNDVMILLQLSAWNFSPLSCTGGCWILVLWKIEKHPPYINSLLKYSPLDTFSIIFCLAWAFSKLENMRDYTCVHCCNPLIILVAPWRNGVQDSTKYFKWICNFIFSSILSMHFFSTVAVCALDICILLSAATLGYFLAAHWQLRFYWC